MSSTNTSTNAGINVDKNTGIIVFGTLSIAIVIMIIAFLIYYYYFDKSSNISNFSRNIKNTFRYPFKKRTLPAPTADIKPNELISNGYGILWQDQDLIQGQYKLSVTSGGTIELTDGHIKVWSSVPPRVLNSPYKLLLDVDGNLCVSDKNNTKVWCSGTANKGTGPWKAVLQPNRNFCVKDSNGRQLWCTGTTK